MGSSGGDGTGSDLNPWDEFLSDPFDTAVRIFSNFATLGTKQYDKNNGGWRDGVGLKNVREFTGDVTGSNRARKEAFKADDRVTEEKMLREQMYRDEITQRKLKDFSASQMAQASRGGDPRKKSETYNVESLDEQKDFLGL